MLKKIAITVAVLLLLLVIVSTVFLKKAGIWNAIFPSSAHDTVAPELPADIAQPAILVFSKTNGFRHVDGIEGGNKRFKAIAEKRGWGHYQTENGAIFTAENLARFSAVVFNSATGDMLNEAQELAFQNWIEAGGGWVGTHAAADGSHLEWDWYAKEVIGVKFTAHIMGPQFQSAEVNVESTTHPATVGLPEQWAHEEEWYSWEASPRPQGFDILATIDEESYTPVQKMAGMNNDLRMGDHPVVWSKCVGKGRVLYSTMGHRASAFDVPEISRLLEGALEWTMGLQGNQCGE